MKLIFLAAAAASTVAGSASAQSLLGGWSRDDYVQGTLGSAYGGQSHLRALSDMSKADADLDPGYFGSLLVGHRLGAGFSLEGEGLYASSDVERRGSGGLIPRDGRDRSVQTYGGLVNLKYEPPIAVHVWRASIGPYVAAGAGYGGSTYGVSGQKDSADGLLWQAKAGLALKLNDRMTWDVGYRYLTGPVFQGSADGTALQALNWKSHQDIVGLGVRWSF